MQQRAMTAYHALGIDGAPRTAIYGLPTLGITLSPAELRQLARQLNTIANDADQGVTGLINYGREDAAA
ncbi:hypothetical protein N7320_01950 [Stutzerimonas stutzeri]|uniref:hypothetical protein n=1 Tax=Stutzerimonas stutzeri TaxID=316 RepID=UPI002446B2D7|nr:hypothetical protein [Stutzerimonas stutzeri]MDH0100077.1 hypothetical protein [Stutzerimonas stutzeri]